MSHSSDLMISPVSDALAGLTLDVIVSGSIGAVESVRFIRSLRRLGARTIPWLTKGGSQFTTETALSWASGGEVVRLGFEGKASHLAESDAVVLAPASASMVAKIAQGHTDEASTALVSSAMGAGIPVLGVANMHDSLMNSPIYQRNLKSVESYIDFIKPRVEEGKQKFPEPSELANEVSHRIRKKRRSRNHSVLVTMGSTKGYFDKIRYLSNYSSGALGSSISEELYRLGLDTFVVAGSCPVLPKVYTQLIVAEENHLMEEKALEIMDQGASAAVVAASVLDFLPETCEPGKIRSADHDRLEVAMIRTHKIIERLKPSAGIKVGFKLEVGLDDQQARSIACDYMKRYQLSQFVMNDLGDVSRTNHKARVFSRSDNDDKTDFISVSGKQSLANFIARHVSDSLES